MIGGGHERERESEGKEEGEGEREVVMHLDTRWFISRFLFVLSDRKQIAEDQSVTQNVASVSDHTCTKNTSMLAVSKLDTLITQAVQWQSKG